MKVLVVGASRGIGLEFVRQYRADGDEVTPTARDAAGLERLRALGATALQLDVAGAASASGLGWPIEGAGFDVATSVTGMRRLIAGLGTGPAADAERGLFRNHDGTTIPW